MKKSPWKALAPLTSQAWRTFKRETDVYGIAKILWPAWQEYQEEWMVYQWTEDQKGAKSGYGFAKFGIDGYEAATLMTLILRAKQVDLRAWARSTEYQPPKVSYTLRLLVSDGDYHFCSIDCETGNICAGKNWPHPLPAGFQDEITNHGTQWIHHPEKEAA